MQLTTAGHLEAVHVVCLFHTQADIGVQLPEQTLTQVTGGDELSFLSCQRAVVDKELHGDGRLGNLLERDGYRVICGADRIADVDICNTGNGYDGADAGRFHFYFVQTVELVQLADLDALFFVRVVMVYQYGVHVDTDFAVVHFADTDTAHIFVVVDGADEHLCACLRISFGSRDVVQDRLKQGNHVFWLVV